MKKLGINIFFFVVIVGGIVWGLPRYLSHSLGSDYPIAAITSGSMWPELHTGDLVFIEHVEKGNIENGDVIVLKNSEGFTIHRVIELRTNTLVTKGDANFRADEPVSYKAIIGRTYERNGKPLRIPYLGHISMFASAYYAAQQ